MALSKLAAPLYSEPEAVAPIVSQADAGPDLAWPVLTEIGLVLAVVGGADLILTWYPFAFQNPEWEFGTVTATLDGMPVLALGLAMVLAGALHSGTLWLIRLASILFGLLALALAAAVLLYLTNIPLALRAIADPSVRIGLYKAMSKTAVQAIAYPSVFLWIALRSWR